VRPFGVEFGVHKKTFSYEFEDHSPRSITYEVGEADQLGVSVKEGIPFIYANREGMLTLAKILIQLSLGEYKDGFHVHLRPDFSDDASSLDALAIFLSKRQ